MKPGKPTTFATFANSKTVFFGLPGEMNFSGFSTISQPLERILMEYIDMKNSLDSELQIYSICSTRISSRS